MNCDSIQPDLKAYIDNELGFARRFVVRRHLSECATCRGEIKMMETITHTLESSETTEPLSDELRERILARAPEGISAAKPAPAAKSRRPLSPALVGAICVALTVAGFVVTHRPLGTLATGVGGQSAVSPTRQDSGIQQYDDPQNAPLPPMVKIEIERNVAHQPAANAGALQELHAYRGGVQSIDGDSPKADTDPSNPLLSDTLSLDRQVHREAGLTVQTKDPEAASDQVEQMVKDAGGFVASNDLTTDGSGLKSAQMTVKVPVTQFDPVLGEIAKLGNVVAKNVTGEDITGKVSDAGQAAAVLDDEVSRSNAHLAALGKRAKWEDEEDARQLRIELAQARARVELLHKLADLAEITVDLTQTPKPTPPVQTGFLNNLHGTGSAAYQSVIGSVGVLLSALIWILAYIPIWGPLVFAGWYLRRYRRDRAGV